ncbi:MAG: helix-turn-helix domain-containing protein [Elusimicrobiota bacterium]
MDVTAETSEDFVRAIRGLLNVSQRELSDRTWTQRALIARIELGREPRLPTLRRLVASLGGRLELVARFERPLEALAAEFQRERDERRVARNWARRRERATG